MSSNGDNSKLQITCPAPCNQRFSTPMPEGDILNTMRSSIFGAPHEKPIRCPTCRQAFVAGIVGVNIQWATQPIPAEAATQLDDSRIIQLKGN